MALELGKKLSKGERINLTKNVDDSGSEKVMNVCVGSNWGAIRKNGFLGMGSSLESVDLDTSVLCYDVNKTKLDEVSFRKLKNSNGSIYHSGDDREGDLSGDDGLDNEVIVINLDKVPSSIKYLVLILNSYTHQNFSEIPYARLRVYEGTPKRVNNVLASYEAEKMNGEAIVLGHFYRKDGWWKFKADGICSSERSIDEISRGTAKDVL